MKKCMICTVLLCLILCACATGVKSGEDAPGAQNNAAPIPTTVVTMSPIVTTTGISQPPAATTTVRPTTRPTTKPVIYTDYKCMYGGHVYQNGYCIYCLAVNPDCAECESTHTYQNGYCIYCPAVDSTYDFCAQGHTYRYGFCIYCGSTDPNYNPCAGGHVYQNGYCIYCLKQQPSAGQPTTVRPTTWPTTVPPTTKVYVDYICQLGAGHTFENGRCIYCGMKGSGGATSTTTRPTTVPICNSTPSRPTTCGLPQCYGKGHTYEKGYCIYCLVMDPNYDPCAGGHVYQNGYCIYCLNQQPSAGQPTTVRPTTRPTTKPVIYTDYKCMFGGHVYQNGNCIYCGRKQAAGDVGAPQTTTASTSSVTTSVDITKPATTMVSTTVSTAATSCKPTKPITVPTTTSPTTAPSTVPTTTASPTTSTTPTVSSSTARYVRVISGDQAITPKEAYYRGRYWNGHGWSLACGKGIVWEWLDWTQIPVITLDEALTIERNPDVAFSQELRLKLVDAEDFEYIDLELVNTLPSGTYMVEFNITYYRSEEVNGEKQFDSYTYGFFLEVP